MQTRFLSEPIEVQFDEDPLLEKKPGCPDRFVWGDQTFEIVDVLAEWHDYWVLYQELVEGERD